MLEVQNLSMRFGGLLAVDEVSLDVQEHEIVSIIGPNGAGKTTVFNCMSGFYKPTGGKILFEGKEVQGKPDYKISRLGMVRTFQHVRLFSQMTVVENLLVAQHRHLNTNLISGLIQTPSYRKKEQKSLDRAAYWLDRVGLLDMANPEAGANERALALSWFLHVLGDIHQPMHVTDYFSAEYPVGNAAGTLSYVWDPLQDSAISLHILWDSNAIRSTALETVDRNAAAFVERYPQLAEAMRTRSNAIKRPPRPKERGKESGPQRITNASEAKITRGTRRT